MTSSTAGVIPACPPLQIADLPRGQISYRSQGHGPAIVFLHGLLGSSKSWAYQFAFFSKTHQTIAWDAPGFGQSDLVELSIDAYVAALREFIAKIGQPKVVLVGHSMGGTVAARLSATHPDMVSRLVLSCTHPGYALPESTPVPAKLEQRMRELEELGRAAYGLNRAKDLLPAPYDPAVFNYAAEVASEVNPEGLRRATRMLQLADNRALMPSLTMPVLVLTGAVDTTVQPALKADLLRLTPFTRHVDMPGLAHAPYFQAPDYYNSLISDFVSEH